MSNGNVLSVEPLTKAKIDLPVFNKAIGKGKDSDKGMVTVTVAIVNTFRVQTNSNDFSGFWN